MDGGGIDGASTSTELSCDPAGRASAAGDLVGTLAERAPAACDQAGSTTCCQQPFSWLANPRTTRAILKHYGFATKHRLGQNFLIDDRVIGRILGLADLTPDDVVLEVGPGIGTLTVALLPRVSQVIAVEADRKLAPVLTKTCAANSGRLTLVWGDALRTIPKRLPLEGADITTFVANLPYQIAATILLLVLERMPRVRRCVVMVQAEVADRIGAVPGTKAYGAYTAKLALYGHLSGRIEVGKTSFMPAPHVQSAVVRIDRSPTGLSGSRLMWTRQVIDAAFAQRRKTIRNSMYQCGYDRSALDAAFATCGIDPRCRAETLGPCDFICLADALL